MVTTNLPLVVTSPPGAFGNKEPEHRDAHRHSTDNPHGQRSLGAWRETSPIHTEVLASAQLRTGNCAWTPSDASDVVLVVLVAASVEALQVGFGVARGRIRNQRAPVHTLSLIHIS